MSEHYYLLQTGPYPEVVSGQEFEPWTDEELPRYLEARRRLENGEFWEEGWLTTDEASSLAAFFIQKNEDGISNADDTLTEFGGQGIAQVEISFIDGSKVSFRPSMSV